MGRRKATHPIKGDTQARLVFVGPGIKRLGDVVPRPAVTEAAVFQNRTTAMDETTPGIGGTRSETFNTCAPRLQIQHVVDEVITLSRSEAAFARSYIHLAQMRPDGWA